MEAMSRFTRSPFIALFLILVTVAASGARTEPTIPVYSYDVVQTYPHDPEAFTQGLLFRDGYLYESTGLRGQSTVRRVDLETGEILQRIDLPKSVFGEGLTDWGSRLIALTWTSGIGYIFNAADLTLEETFRYPGQGWGLTRSDQLLFMSDGSAQLRIIDPSSLTELRRISVTANGVPVPRLNELEWVRGEIYANIWLTDRIARIDPESGAVTAWIDLSGLLENHGTASANADVLNGIAYDAAEDRLFVTGKRWPNLFEIELIPPRSAQ